MDASSSSGTSWTYQEAKSKCSERHSCFIEVQVKEHMSLSPYYIGRIRSGVQEEIECKIHRWEFLDEYKGVIVAYNNIKLLQSSAEIYGESPSIHFDIKVNYIIFKPEIGKKLVGVVNKTSSTHVGCLVHGCFNASLAKPKFCQNGWIGGRLDIGTEFQFRVSDLQTVAGVLSIVGEIKDKDAKYFRPSESSLVDNQIEDADDVCESNLDDHGKNSKKKKLRESGEKYRVQEKKEVLQTMSIDEDNSGRKKAIKKEPESENETSETDKPADVAKSSLQGHSGKKKKKDVSQTMSIEEDNSGRKKAIKKEPESENETSETDKPADVAKSSPQGHSGKKKKKDVSQTMSIEEDNSGRKKARKKEPESENETSETDKPADVAKSSPQVHSGKQKNKKTKDVKDPSISDVSSEHGNSGKKKKKSREKDKDFADETSCDKLLNNEKNNNAEKLIKKEPGSKRKRSNSPGRVKNNK